MRVNLSNVILFSAAIATSVAAASAQTATATAATTTSACSAITLGTNGALNGWVPSPADAWHENISSAAVDSLSSAIISGLGGASIHPDFANPNTYPAGISYDVVDSSTQAMVPISVGSYASESDLSVEPLSASMPIEGNAANCTSQSSLGDAHAIVLDRATCVAYEIYQANYCPKNNPAFSGTQTTIWDFTQTEKRPLSWTSTDAAGLSVFEGLIRYDEIKAGVIKHAIRFTVNLTKDNANGGYFVPPASHSAGNNWGTDNVLGMRLRLKSSFNISGFSPTNQIILKAMQQYGLILADNGSDMYIQGTADTGWNDDDLQSLGNVNASDFDVVDMSGNSSMAASYTPGVAPLYPHGTVMDSEYEPTGSAPTASLKASATAISKGQSVTLTPTTSGASYSYIDKLGFVRAAVTVTPTATTTYTLYSNNEFGSAKATPVTVTVSAATSKAVPSLSFVTVPEQKVGTTATLSAKSNSSGALTFSSLTPSIVTVSGTTAKFIATGTARLEVRQAGSGNYQAGAAQTSFTVGQAPTISFSVTERTYPGTVVLDPHSNSPGAFTYKIVSGPGTISGRDITLTGAGEITVQAIQAASETFVAGTATTSFKVNQ